MVKFLFTLFIISLLFLFPVHSQIDQNKNLQANQDRTSNIYLRTYVESESVPLNLEVVYYIELKWDGDLNLYKISELKEPTAVNLIHRGSGTRNIVSTGKDGKIISTKIISYYFKPVEIGMAYIDGLFIKYEDTVSGQEGNLLSSRIGVKIIDPLPEPSNNFFSRELIFIVIVLSLIILIGYFVLRFQIQKKKAKEKDSQLVKETVEEKYLRLLKETIQLNPDNIKEGIVDLSHLLTGYFSESLAVPVANLSTDDLIQLLSDNKLDETTLSRVKEFYTQTNLIKFAGTSINESELHRFYDIVEMILNSQKQKHDYHSE
jgi:hypothetical protein